MLCFSSRFCSWSPTFVLVPSLVGAANQKSVFSSSTELFFLPLSSQHSVVCPGKWELVGPHGGGPTWNLSRSGKGFSGGLRWASTRPPECLSNMGWAEGHWAPWHSSSNTLLLHPWLLFKPKASNLQHYCWGIQPLHCSLPASALPRPHKLCRKSLQLLTDKAHLKSLLKCMRGRQQCRCWSSLHFIVHVCPVSSKLFVAWSCLFSVRHLGWASEAKIAHVIDAWTWSFGVVWNSNKSPSTPCEMSLSLLMYIVGLIYSFYLFFIQLFLKLASRSDGYC